MRRHRNPKEQTLMKRRQRFATWQDEVQLGRWFKRHPLDCGRPGCGVCHSTPKGHPRKRGLDA